MKRLFLLALSLLGLGFAVQLCAMDVPLQPRPEPRVKRVSRVELWEAIQADSLQGVNNFIQNHQPYTALGLNRPTPYGEMALSFAVQRGNPDIVALLLGAGADPNLHDINGNTPLHYAADQNRSVIIDRLIAANADINVKNSAGLTPLMLAANKGADKSVNKLIAAGARLDEKDNEGYTALDIAQEEKHFSTVLILRAAQKAQQEAPLSPKKREGDGKENVTKAKKKIQAPKTQQKGVKTKKKKAPVQSVAAGESIWQAAAKGDLKQVNNRISAGWSGNDKDAAGETPLMLAAEQGHVLVVEAFIKRKGLKINAVDAQGNTALMRALRAGDVAVGKLLLDADADPAISNKDGENPLLLAIEKGLDEVIDLLIAGGADPNQRTATEPHYSMLMVAADQGKATIISILINAGADIHAKAQNDRTALMIAASRDYDEIVNQLLASGASLDDRDAFGRTAFDYAQESGSQKTIQLFEQIKNQQEKRRINSERLLNAVVAKNEKDVKKILAQDVDLEIINEYGETPLAVAAHRGYSRIVNLLLQNGAQVDTRAKTGLTPLHSAVMGGRIEIALLLLQHGANINAQDTQRGRTPLHWVVRMTEGSVKKEAAQLPVQTSVALLRFLLQRGADASVVDLEGKAPLYWAQAFHLDPLVAVLEKAPIVKPKSPPIKAKNTSPKQKQKG